MNKCFLLLAMLAFCGGAYAQGGYDRLHENDLEPADFQRRGFIEAYGTKFVYAVDGKDEKLANPLVYAALGYSFNKNVSLSGVMDIGYALFRDYIDSSNKSLGKERDYKIYSTLGVQLDVNAFEAGRDVVSFGVAAGNTIFSKWHHFYVDAGASYIFKPRVRTLTPYITGGVRFIRSHSDSHDNHFGLYLGVGVRFND